MTLRAKAWPRTLAFWLAPLCAVLAARVATQSDLAQRYPRTAALLFLWVAADSLTLALLARSPGNRPGLRAMLGSVSAGGVIVILGAAPHIRMALLGMDGVVLAMALTGGAYLGWSLTRAIAIFRKSGSLENAIGEMLPARFVSFVASELGMIRLAFLGWRRSPEVPIGATAFHGHQIESQMIAVVLALQFIEIGVVHLLVWQWNETAAFVLLALSIWGVVFTLALLNGLRLYPVLLTDSAVRVRNGPFLDAIIPLGAIKGMEASISHEECKRRDVERATLLTHPNIILRLDPPLERRGFLGRSRFVERFAFRLDEPGPFVDALRGRWAAD